MKRTWTVSLIAAFAIFVTTVRAEPWMSDPIISDGWGPFLIYRNLVNMRIGSSPGAYGDWEIGLHTRQFGFIPVATERNYIWPNGADPNSWMGDNPDSEFTLTFTKETGTVDFTIGYAPTLSYDYEEYAEMGMDTLYLMARTKMPKYTCAITDLKLNGSGIENAGDLIISGTHMYATIGGIDCNDFTLTGNVVFSYTEGNPRHSKIEALIAFGRAGPGPVIIDGKIDEWKTAGSRYIYADGTLGGDQIGTGKLYTGYDDKNFYLAYKLEGTSSKKERDILAFDGGFHFPDVNDIGVKYYNSLIPQPTEFVRTDTTLELRQNWQRVRPEGAVYGEWFIELISNKPKRIIRFGSIMDGNPLHGTGNVNNLDYYAGSYDGGEPFPGVYVNDDVDENGWILTGFDSSDPNFGRFYLSEPLHSDEVWTLVDRASIELKGPEYNPYVVELKSIGDEAPPWGSILFRPSEPMTFNDIDELSADYNITEGRFGGGSPRFSILIDWNDSHVADPGDEYAFLYWGTPPDYTDIIPSDWQNTGNLYDSNDVRIDLTKFGGPFYATIGDAKALFGDKNVFEVILVLDGGWIDDQVMLVDNITIDDYTYDALPLPSEVDINCDINGDGEITMPDLSIMALNWLRQDCLVADCNSADIAPLVRDGVVDNVDLSAMNNCWQDGVIPDTISPDPNIMTWSSEPNALAGTNSITMTATTATDKSGVEYYFKNVTLPTHNSSWQPDPTYTDTELEPGTEYTYQVKARDLSPYKNETQYSVPASAVAEGSPEAIEVEDIFVPVPPHDARIWDDGFGTGEGFDRDDSDYKALRLGDYNTNQSYRILLGFDTSSLPTDAEIISARLQLTCGSKEGTSPFKGWGGTCAIDIASPYFGDSEDIEIADWNNSADAYNVAQFTTDPGAINPIISTDFNTEGLSQINTYGTTQLRVYFTTPRSLNDRNDFVGFYSAEQEVYLDKRPQLIIRYKSRTPTMAIPGIAAHDGRVYDNGYGTGLGGIDNENSSKALRLGDYLSNQSYRSVVSFDTSVFPENYTIEGVMLKLASGAKSGSDPFTWGGTCTIDLGVPDFGTSKYLEAVDWQAAATVAGVASFASAPADPNEGYYMVSSRFSPEGRMNINLNGLTQLRVYFTTPRNDNIDSDYLGFYSAEAVETRKPKLLIEYSID